MNPESTFAVASSPADDSARAVFLAWEKLRLLFNAILAGVVLMFAHQTLAHPPFWYFLSTGAIIANVCFCAGPVAEGYLTLIGADRRAARGLVFVFGTLAGCFLAFTAVVGWAITQF